MRLQLDTFWRSVGIAFSGAAVAQSIPLLGSLAIARLFAPSEYGVFSAWIGIVALLAVIITGRFETALAIVADECRDNAVLATLVTSLISSSLVFLFLLLGIFIAPLYFKLLPMQLYLILVPAAFFTAASYTWQCWAGADGRLHSLSVMRVIQASTITGLQIIAGWIMPNATGLAFGYLLGAMAGLLGAVSLLPLKKESGGIMCEVRNFWKSHYRFPLLSLPADAINSAAGQLPILILTSRFGADIAGFFALAVRVLGAPMARVGAAILDVFKRKSAMSFRMHGNCADDYMRTFKVMMAGALAITIFTALLAENVFVLAFGESWRNAGVFAVWLIPMFGLRFVASPLSYIFYVAGKQHMDLLWQIALLATTIMALYLPQHYSDSIKSYSVAYAGLYIIYLFLSWRFSKGENS